MDCDFYFDEGGGLWTCRECKVPRRRPFTGPQPPRRNCPAAITPEARAAREAELTEARAAYAETIGPSLPERLGHYARALVAWRKAGYPVRTDEEVAAIVAICQTCQKFADWECVVCGCAISESHWAVRNKARMGSEHCTMGKWR